MTTSKLLCAYYSKRASQGVGGSAAAGRWGRLKCAPCPSLLFLSRAAVHEWPGAAKLFIPAHFRSFPIMPVVDGGGGRLELRLGLHPHPNLLPSREKGPELSRERRGGVNPGPIWPCLASFTPSGEAENGATVASFGTALTRTRWASWPWLWPWLALSRVARSGEIFSLVAFGCIWLLFLSSTRGRDASFPRRQEQRRPM